MSSEGPLARWSRRKRAAKTEEAAPLATDDSAPVEAPEVDDSAYLEAHGLTAPEDMEEGADFTAFMKTGVPDALRRRALRRLWQVNPTLANLDGLLEYGEDYTDAAMVPQIVATAYQVGRGFLREEAPQDRVESDAEDAAEEVRAPEFEPVVEPEEVVAAPLPVLEDTPPDPSESDGVGDDEMGRRPARMRFTGA